jgi:hypothetical protein
MEFNATFNNISVIAWRSILLVEETGENHRHAASLLQTLSYTHSLKNKYYHSARKSKLWTYLNKYYHSARKSKLWTYLNKYYHSARKSKLWTYLNKYYHSARKSKLWTYLNTCSLSVQLLNIGKFIVY